MSTSGRKQTPKSRIYSMEDIAAILGIRKSVAYKIAYFDDFQTIWFGNIIRISKKSFEN